MLFIIHKVSRLGSKWSVIARLMHEAGYKGRTVRV
jgi:hypothetical protein